MVEDVSSTSHTDVLSFSLPDGPLSVTLVACCYCSCHKPSSISFAVIVSSQDQQWTVFRSLEDFNSVVRSLEDRTNLPIPCHPSLTMMLIHCDDVTEEKEKNSHLIRIRNEWQSWLSAAVSNPRIRKSPALQRFLRNEDGNTYYFPTRRDFVEGEVQDEKGITDVHANDIASKQLAALGLENCNSSNGCANVELDDLAMDDMFISGDDRDDGAEILPEDDDHQSIHNFITHKDDEENDTSPDCTEQVQIILQDCQESDFNNSHPLKSSVNKHAQGSILIPSITKKQSSSCSSTCTTENSSFASSQSKKPEDISPENSPTRSTESVSFKPSSILSSILAENHSNTLHKPSVSTLASSTSSQGAIKETNNSSTTVANSLDSFEIIKVIGKGSFGKVFMVKERQSAEIYALKVLRKDYIVKRNQVEHTKTERNILGYIHHPFIVGMKMAFQSQDKLYFVLEYCAGGELFFHLGRLGKFSESRSRFYTAEIILALKYIHSLGIVYRDLKPENILLDVHGHLRLTDFGLSKEGVRDCSSGCRTFCGTPEYLAPEILERKGYGRAVDWWSLGALLFEMLTGLPPFYCSDKQKLFEKVRHSELDYPSDTVKPAAKSLLQGLLTKDPLKRLGSGPEDAEELQCHEFFTPNIDWNLLLKGEVTPPWVPKFSSSKSENNSGNDDIRTDSHYFDKQFTNMPVNSPQTLGNFHKFFGGSTNNNKNAFEGFNFTDHGFYARRPVPTKVN